MVYDFSASVQISRITFHSAAPGPVLLNHGGLRRGHDISRGREKLQLKERIALAAVRLPLRLINPLRGLLAELLRLLF